MSNIDPRIIKKTQTSLGKFIKKPPLTDKLLNKPPFRFLHDIFITLNKDTGVFNGLFTPEELKSENVKDKDTKIAFLQKIIDVIAYASEETVTARPSKIVAGHEADKTNELLQLLARIVDKKINTEEFVNKVLKGDKPNKATKKAGTKAAVVDNKKKQETDTKSIKGDKAAAAQEIKSGTKPKSKSPDKGKSLSNRPKKKSVPEDVPKAVLPNKNESKIDEPRVQSSITRDTQNNDEEIKQQINKDDNDEDLPITEKAPSRPGTTINTHQFVHSIGNQISTGDDAVVSDEMVISTQESIEAFSANNESDRPVDIEEAEELQTRSQENISELAKLISSPAEIDLSDGANMHDGLEKVDFANIDSSTTHSPAVTRPSTSIQRQNRPRTGLRSARPPSARPAPPKVRERHEMAQESMTSPAAGKVTTNVIIDANKDDDEDDEYLIQEKLAAEDVLSDSFTAQTDATPKETDGLLINQLLETKSDFEKQAIEDKAYDNIEIERSHVIEASRLKEKEQQSQELNKLRNSIQLLTRSANPLGKMMDYLLEDMDSMEKEREQWQKENHNLALQLQKDKSETENLLRPLIAMLTELDASVLQQNEKISIVKSNILRNSEKIHRLLANMGAGNRL